MDLNIKAKALELKNQGLSYQQIADQLGLGKTTVYNMIANEVENTSAYSSHSDISGTIEELKSEILALRHKMSRAVPENIDAKQLVELRKLELEHDYNMKEMEIDNRAAKLIEEVDDLRDQNRLLNAEYERSKQEQNELVMQENNLQGKINGLESFNAELESKISMLEDPTTVLSVDSIDEYQEDFSNSIVSLLREYLDFNWDDCSKMSVEDFQQQANDLEADISSWMKEADENVFDVKYVEILESLIVDIEEGLEEYEQQGAEVLDLYLNNDWQEEMEAWLETLE